MVRFAGWTLVLLLASGCAGELDDDPRCVAAAFARVIERLGLRTGQRRLGITIHSRRTPSPSELEAAVRDFDLARLTLTAPTAVTGRLER